MTDRIYYTDPYCVTFEAGVTRVFAHDGKPAVFLDRTAFYPTSGGQPNDIGTIAGVPVLDVVDLDDGAVAHVLEVDAGSDRDGVFVEGARVQGTVDWVRRFDHMQQHTGQHVLSSAFDRLFDNRTMSFHMGGDVSTIDLAREASPDAISAAEAEANRIVWRCARSRFAAARFGSSTLPISTSRPAAARTSLERAPSASSR
jgi:alanyl-tRNA synthetase